MQEPIINHIGISASQNVYSSQAGVDQREARSVLKYLEKGSMVSLKFARTADMLRHGYDENKALFPVYDGVPLFAVGAIAMLEAGMDVSVVGSYDVAVVLNELYDYYVIEGEQGIADRIHWRPEVDGFSIEGNPAQKNWNVIADRRKRLTLGNSISRLADGMGDNRWAFYAGDQLTYDPSFAYDEDVKTHAVVVDLNGLESIDPPVPRNYYHAIRMKDGSVVMVKEPNIWLFGGGTDYAKSDVVYANRMKGGFGVRTFLKLAGWNIMTHPSQITKRDIATLCSAAWQESRHLLTGKKVVPLYDQADIERIARFIYMAPIRVKAEHGDWLRLKDVDGMHDYLTVKLLLEQHLREVMPSNIADRLEGCAAHLKNRRVAKRIPVMRYLPEYLNQKVDRVESAIRRRRKYRHEKLPLKTPFLKDGTVNPEAVQDDLGKILERCKRDLDRYERKQSERVT